MRRRVHLPALARPRRARPSGRGRGFGLHNTGGRIASCPTAGLFPTPPVRRQVRPAGTRVRPPGRITLVGDGARCRCRCKTPAPPRPTRLTALTRLVIRRRAVVERPARPHHGDPATSSRDQIATTRPSSGVTTPGCSTPTCAARVVASSAAPTPQNRRPGLPGPPLENGTTRRRGRDPARDRRVVDTRRPGDPALFDASVAVI